MTRSIRRLVMALFFFGSVFLVAERADATSGSQYGYACNIIHYPFSSSMGTGGYVSVDLYSASACGGTFYGTYYLMTSGNSFPTLNYYSADALLAHLQNLGQYAVTGKKVYISAASSPNNVIQGVYYQGF